MITRVKNILKDTLYVSKLTKTKNKKLIILLAVVLSQLIAVSDILIIILFTNILSSGYELPNFINFLENIFESKIFLPMIVLVRYLFQYTQNTILKKMELEVQQNVKVHLLSEVFNKKNYSSSDAFYYINTLTSHIGYFYASIANLFNFLLQTFAFLIYLIITEPKTITAFLIGVALLIVPITFLIKNARTYMHISFVTGQKANEEIQRVVDNVFLIKLLKKENEEIGRFYNSVKEHLSSVFKNYKFTILNSYFPSFVTVFLLSIISNYYFESFNITIGFLGVTLRLFQSIGQFSNSVNQVVNSHVHIDEFYKIEKEKPIVNREHFLISNDLDEIAVKFTNVSFKYTNSEKLIFENLNINFDLNKHSLITGINGSGKSTLLGLISGVYFSNSGLIEIFSNNFGYVGPTPLIFNGTLKENILYGVKNNLNREDEVIKFLNKFKVFQQSESIDLNQEIDAKSLSSGQIQKVSFIRALLNNPSILFLDESTSNLDKESKLLIFEMLKEYKLTIINSSHDFDMLGICDHHYLIDVFKDRREIKKIT